MTNSNLLERFKELGFKDSGTLGTKVLQFVVAEKDLTKKQTISETYDSIIEIVNNCAANCWYPLIEWAMESLSMHLKRLKTEILYSPDKK